MMKSKKRLIIIMICVVLIIAIALIYQIYSSNKTIKNNQKNIANANNIVESNGNSNSQYGEINPTNELVSDDYNTNEIKDIYSKDIESDEIIKSLNIQSYKINRITPLTVAQKQVVVDMGGENKYKITDTFAYITYSVKPENLDSSVLNTGLGVQNGDWITFYDVCVCIRNGKVISAGTSW